MPSTTKHSYYAIALTNTCITCNTGNISKEYLTRTLCKEVTLNHALKHYINTSLLYAVLAMIGGVFYREFTKFNAFHTKTVLAVVHTHYFMLGMVVFLLLILVEKNFSFSNEKTTRILITYHIGLNLTAVMMVTRGITQVLRLHLSPSIDFAITGLAGIGHILLGVSIVLILLQIKHSITHCAQTSVK